MSEDIKHKTKIGMYWTFLNQGSTQVMQFVVGIVMARMLTPEDFGITALPAVFMAIATVFLDSGFGQALTRKETITEKDLSTSFYYSLGMGFFMYCILFFLSPWIADFYDTPVLTSLIRVTALNFLWGPLATPQYVILQRKLDFKTPAKISILNKLVGGFAGILAAYMGLGLWSLVISGLISSLLGIFQYWLAVKWVPREKFDRSSFSYLWNYGNKLLGANLLDVMYNNIAPIVIGKFYTPQALGLYNRAEGYAKLPANQIIGIIQGVSFPVLSKLQSDKELLSRSYRKMIKLSAFIAFPVFCLLCALAHPLVVVMITEKWESCVIYLQIICFAKMWWPVMSLNRSALQVQGRSDLYLKMEMMKRFTNFVLMCIALNFGLLVFCCYQILETIVAMCFNTYYTGKLLDVGLLRQTRDVLPSYLLSLFMLGLVFLVNSYVENPYMQICVGGSVGMLFYIVGAYLFKFNEIEDVKYMLSRKK